MNDMHDAQSTSQDRIDKMAEMALATGPVLTFLTKKQ